jgi:hypothetical protein
MASNLGSYENDFKYLKELSDKGALQATNSIFKDLDAKARNFPPLRRALDTLKVNY